MPRFHPILSPRFCDRRFCLLPHYRKNCNVTIPPNNNDKDNDYDSDNNIDSNEK